MVRPAVTFEYGFWIFQALSWALFTNYNVSKILSNFDLSNYSGLLGYEFFLRGFCRREKHPERVLRDRDVFLREGAAKMIEDGGRREAGLFEISALPHDRDVIDLWSRRPRIFHVEGCWRAKNSLYVSAYLSKVRSELSIISDQLFRKVPDVWPR